MSDARNDPEQENSVRQGAGVERILRDLTPQVLAILVRRHGQFDACEDAVQEALLAAATSWPADGIPESPRAWLVAVAHRRLVDEWRSGSARRRREDQVATRELTGAEPVDVDDTLTLLFLCCHPALSVPAQLALTLRAVGGLTTAEIGRAFLVPETTMAQRISRAKATISKGRFRFELPDSPERSERLRVVLHVLYLVFNEGYSATSGPVAQRADLVDEAIRLTRLLARLLPDQTEVRGLLALMLLTDARRAARVGDDGILVPLADQRRDLWDAGAIAEGVRIIGRTLGTGPVGPYQVQAAIAALHDEAPTAAATDWPQILALYRVLERLIPGPVVTLNLAVALAMVDGPLAGLAVLGTVEQDTQMHGSHRVDAVRAHLLEMAGDAAGAREAYSRAAGRTANVAERHYLMLRAAGAVVLDSWSEPQHPAGDDE
ncbi:RNA polymerase sigma factor (sigma-70 family) [Nakamurella sp. UYEF19]|uniref:RNA polymerase sigma factor n=1 Tax=Nakamurella sp. UYEF19 TaxID=1756392 RepID=UPI003392F9A0